MELQQRMRSFFIIPAVCVFLATGCGPSQPAPASAPAVSDRTTDAAIATAEQLIEESRWKEAESVLTALVVKAPTNAHAHELLGEVLSSIAVEARDAGRTEEFQTGIQRAFDSYMKAVSLAPGQAGLHHAAGVIADLAGRPDEARALYQRASDLAPDNPQFLLYLAQSASRAEEYPKATAALVKLLRIEPDEPWAYACLAEVELAEERYNMALDHIRQARSIAPEELGFRSTEAKILRRLHQPENALELLLALPVEQQLTEPITFEIAVCHTMLGDHFKAAEAWERCCRADAQNWRAACEASECYIRARRLDLAKVWLDASLMIAPDQPKVHGLQKLFQQAAASAAASP